LVSTIGRVTMRKLFIVMIWVTQRQFQNEPFKTS